MKDKSANFGNWKFILTLILIFIIIMPIIINFIILSNIGIQAAHNNDWIGFFGGYFGGIITLAGVWLTIKYYREKDKEDKRLSVKPYFIVMNTSEIKPADCYRMYFTNIEKKQEQNRVINCIFYIKNVGLGTAVNINFYSLSMHEKTKETPPLNMTVKDKEPIQITITDPIRDSIGNALYLTITFSDLLEYHYEQRIKIEINSQLIMKVTESFPPSLVNKTT